jgi:hypothetical protein
MYYSLTTKNGNIKKNNKIKMESADKHEATYISKIKFHTRVSF